MDFNFTNAPSDGEQDPAYNRELANLAYIKQAADAIGEHFDCVVVLAHTVDPSGRVCRYARVCGDPLAAQQAAVLFIQDNMIQFARTSGNGPANAS